MELRFPKARLLAYSELSRGANCFSVLVQSVIDSGLISEDLSAKLSEEHGSGNGCSCLNAARKIIDAYMCERHDAKDAGTFADASFNRINADVERWQKTASLSERNCNDGTASLCRDKAPVVLDLLLQEIIRH